MQKKLSTKQIQKFQHKIYQYYRTNKRHFPWRQTTSPYRIMVSEIMLQQTQTDRVVGYYNKFIKRFPTVKKISNALFRDVFAVWQGLGYNRRALMLHNAAKEVVEKYQGRFPRDPEELQALPGIGPYTASAIVIFAYNQPSVLIETNIRAVYIHEFFPFHYKERVGRGSSEKKIHDRQILPLIEQTLDNKNPRDWYNALMDYGAYLKKEHPNPSRKSLHYMKQSPFKGSNREMRGAILRELTSKESRTLNELIKRLPFVKPKVLRCILDLEKEGLIMKQNKRIMIASRQ